MVWGWRAVLGNLLDTLLSYTTVLRGWRVVSYGSYHFNSYIIFLLKVIITLLSLDNQKLSLIRIRYIIIFNIAKRVFHYIIKQTEFRLGGF